MKPTIGRIVHYVSHGTPIREDGSQAFTKECRAAIVTEVDPDDPKRIGLHAFNPTGDFKHPLGLGGCTQDEGQTQGGTWHWPERENESAPPLKDGA